LCKKIEGGAMVGTLNLGNYITDDPENPEDFYKVKDILNGFVLAIHSNGKTKVSRD
jgi:hypothetical protein